MPTDNAEYLIEAKLQYRLNSFERNRFRSVVRLKITQKHNKLSIVCESTENRIYFEIGMASKHIAINSYKNRFALLQNK
jgi:hypothetical protein